MFKLYMLLKRGRLQKKGRIYKRLFHMSFDVTMMLYVLLLIGYFIFASVRSGNVFNQIQHVVLELEAISIDYFWVVMTVIPLGLLLRTFSHPGITISTAEHTVMALPYTPREIWRMAALERWGKFALILTIIGSGLWFFSPTSGPVIVLYISLLFLINILMTIIEWRVFQLHVFWKIIIFALAIGVNILSIFTSPPIIGAISLVLLAIISIVLLPRIVQAIDWKKVTIACDYKLWNMFIVSYMTKQKIKKERSYTLWQRLPFWRKSLPYQKESLYHRLWHIYLQRQLAMIGKLVGALLVLIGFVPVTNRWLVDIGSLFGYSITLIQPWIFYVFLSIAIHIYASFVAVLWKDRLTADIVEVVPWSVRLFHQTLLRWAFVGSVVFLLPVGLFAYDSWSILFVGQMVIAGCAHLFILYWKIVDIMRTVSDEVAAGVPKHLTMLGYSLLILMILSVFLPYVLIIAYILLALIGLAHIRFRLIRM